MKKIVSVLLATLMMVTLLAGCSSQKEDWAYIEDKGTLVIGITLYEPMNYYDEDGKLIGFDEKTADIRMAQYESGSRTPKADLTENLAGVLGVSPLALSVPDIDSYLGLMHTLFTLEDRYGLTIEKGENGVSLRVDPRKGKDAAELSEMLNAWAKQAEKYHNGDISREDYDKWRYNYPKYDENSGYVKVPSQGLSDKMIEAFKDRLKND